MKRHSVILFLLFSAILFVNLTPAILSDPKEDKISVTVRGAVTNEKRVELPMYATINDVLDLITLSDDADTSSLNPNTILKDADVITIPHVSTNASNKISINTATASDLTELSGIGPALASRIIEYRETNGLFQTIEDLMNVKGIGQAKFDSLKESITL